jgi:hypothetical protein
MKTIILFLALSVFFLVCFTEVVSIRETTSGSYAYAIEFRSILGNSAESYALRNSLPYERKGMKTTIFANNTRQIEIDFK